MARERIGRWTSSDRLLCSARRRSAMDVCVVTYRNDAGRIEPAVRSVDRLIVEDNTYDNVGFAAGANRAAVRGGDPLIVFMNPDGTPAPDCLEQLERAFDDPAVVGAEASQGPTWDRPAGPDGTIDWLSGGCLAVRRDAFEAVGGFDERLFMYGEDVDLSYRLAARGRLVHRREAVFLHDAGERGFLALHRAFRNATVVDRRHRRAGVGRLVRDAGFSARRGELRRTAARLTALLDYVVRARRWSRQPPLNSSAP
jgi:GT2 family glycosyltransferase